VSVNCGLHRVISASKELQENPYASVTAVNIELSVMLEEQLMTWYNLCNLDSAGYVVL